MNAKRAKATPSAAPTRRKVQRASTEDIAYAVVFAMEARNGPLLTRQQFLDALAAAFPDHKLPAAKSMQAIIKAAKLEFADEVKPDSIRLVELHDLQTKIAALAAVIDYMAKDTKLILPEFLQAIKDQQPIPPTYLQQLQLLQNE